MNAKEYLEKAYRLDQRINSKIAQMDALRSLAEKSTATIRKDPANGGNGRLMEETIIKIVDMEREISAEIDRLVDLKREIAEVISRVEDQEAQIVLELRYLCFKEWPEIWDQMHCSKATVHRIYHKGLENVEEIINSVWAVGDSHPRPT